jgi:hypothetical protein
MLCELHISDMNSVEGFFEEVAYFLNSIMKLWIYLKIPLLHFAEITVINSRFC